MKKFICVLSIFCLFLTGCRIQRQTQVKATDTSIEQKNIREEIQTEASTQKSESKQEITDTKEATNENIIEVRLSAPDSAGKQYPTSIVRITKGSEISQKTTINSIIDEYIDEALSSSISDSSRTESNRNYKSDTSTKTEAQLQWLSISLIVALVIGLVVLICIGVYLYKKYRL